MKALRTFDSETEVHRVMPVSLLAVRLLSVYGDTWCERASEQGPCK
jgi:hypothetical protein